MLQSTFNSLPQRVQTFITLTGIPRELVNVNDFACVPTPKVYFSNKNGKYKECRRFSAYDAELVRRWYAIK